MMKRVLSCITIVLLGAASAANGGPEVTTSLNFRIRWESFGTPSGSTGLDSTYNFTNLRARFGAASRWDHLTLRGEVQGAGASQLPVDGAFAIGPVYTAANGGDTRLSQVGFSELIAAVHSQSARLDAGRQKWADGGETMTGVSYLDGVKKRRVAERLIGNWDWVNVGRRFDGVSGGASLGSSHVGGFAFRPLAGGVNYNDSFSRLDGLEIYGVHWTGKYDELLPSSELRVFAIRYDDDRPGAVAAADGKLKLDTFGATLLSGGDTTDLLVWAAYQGGDWGASKQSAWAFIAETGRKIETGDRSYTFRAGIAQASGDDDAQSGEHRSFFNLLPTNHKFYGSMDYNAFSNLRNIYGELHFQSGATGKWSASGAYHFFQLVEKNDAWYGGSGAFDLSRLGYAGRRPAAGEFSSSNIGHELDLTFGWKLHRLIRLDFGWSYFWGGAAAADVLTADRDGSWGFAQVVILK